MKSKAFWCVCVVSLILLLAGIMNVFIAVASAEALTLSSVSTQAIIGGLMCIPYVILQTYFL